MSTPQIATIKTKIHVQPCPCAWCRADADNQPTREQKCADLARAMGYRAVKDGSYFYLLDPNGDKQEDVLGYHIGSTCEEGIWASAPNPYESAEDSRALVAWLAKQREADRFNNELARVIGPTPLQTLLAPLPVIADAAWRAIQEKQ